jgi:hypothetical protein
VRITGYLYVNNGLNDFLSVKDYPNPMIVKGPVKIDDLAFEVDGDEGGCMRYRIFSY